MRPGGVLRPRDRRHGLVSIRVARGAPLSFTLVDESGFYLPFAARRTPRPLCFGPIQIAKPPIVVITLCVMVRTSRGA